MPVWSWWLIWSVLAIALVLVVLFTGRSVLASWRGVTGEAQKLEGTIAALSTATAELQDAAQRAREPRPRAVFAPMAEVVERREERRSRRALRRQARRDKRIARGRLITHSAQNWTAPHV